MNPEQLDALMGQVIAVTQQCREQVFLLLESTRAEVEAARRELEDARREAQAIMRAYDDARRQWLQARRHLADVSRRVHAVSEEAIRAAYEEASRLQEQLSIYQERERHMRQRREELERRLRHLEGMVRRAEELLSQIGVVLDFLSGKVASVLANLCQRSAPEWLGLAILQAQEEERKRVAREIHDGPAQTLANVVLRADMADRCIAKREYEAARRELQDVKNLVRESLIDVRRIIFDLRPMSLDDLGLVPTLRKYLSTLEERHGLPVRLRVEGGERRLDPAVEVALFRLIQESLNNVVKHAAATRAEVAVHFLPGAVSVEVADNGRGFDPASIGEGHFGIFGMRERVQLLKGQFALDSQPGKGTSVRFTVPIRSAAQIRPKESGRGEGR
ncbi:sensor histidine kinase [Calditerricola satsumensis]|uniref:Signal transduction histidine-protein kinase/phosphatase DegS n=3 Tax=Calditerricola satsumensis TaxID=373054 RepID=A0A8J3BE71_9BACI|nr:sensor histidine kinase [Calditerricola satsumensis]GGK08204.1 histidine kinase [Calditerricola satsumensis]